MSHDASLNTKRLGKGKKTNQHFLESKVISHTNFFDQVISTATLQPQSTQASFLSTGLVGNKNDKVADTPMTSKRSHHQSKLYDWIA